MAKIFVIVAVAFGISAGYGQECAHSLSGKVVDEQDGSPVIGATILLKEKNKYYATGIDGSFIMKALCKGPLVLTISSVGYQKRTTTINNIPEKGAMKIALKRSLENLKEVEVVGLVTEGSTVQKGVLDTKAIEAYSSKSLGEALKEVPGVSALSTGTNIAKPMINGLHSSRVVIITDGIRLEDQEWGVEHAPNVDLNSAQKITVIKGAGALAYAGNAIGGVVVLEPKHMEAKDSLYGKTIVSGQSNGLGGSAMTTLAKTFKKGWYIDAQGNYKRYGDLQSPNYNLSNTGLNSYSYSVRAGYQTKTSGIEAAYTYIWNNIAILRSSNIGNVRDLVYAINSRRPFYVQPFTYEILSPRQRIAHHTAKIDAFRVFEGVGKLSFQYDFQNNHRYEYDLRIGRNRFRPALDLELNTHTANVTFKTDAFDNFVGDAGLVGQYQTNFSSPDTGIQRLIPDYSKIAVGAFATGIWHLNNHLDIEAGLRYDFSHIDALHFYQKTRWAERGYPSDFQNIIIADYPTQVLANPIFDYHNASASLGVGKRLGESHAFSLNYALSSRAPNPAELFSNGLHHAAARIELGNLRLKQEYSNRLSATYTYTHKDILKVDVEPFLNGISHYIYDRPVGVETSIRGAFPVWEYGQTNALLAGIDASITYNFLPGWSLSNKSSYTYGYDSSERRPLISMPPFRTINTLTYQNKRWKNLTLEVRSEWLAMQRNYPDFNFMQFLPTENQEVLVDISTPPPGYHLLHANASMSFNKHFRLSLFATNIFNVAYRDYLDRMRYFADNIGRNISLQLTINY